MKDLKNKVSFEIDGEEYEFRKFTINDNIWQEENEIDIAPIFSDPIDTKGLSRIMYHQLVDKSVFPIKNVVYYDEDGRESKKDQGGLFSFREMISGQAEVLKLLKSFSELLVLSRPDLKEDSEEDTGKK